MRMLRLGFSAGLVVALATVPVGPAHAADTALCTLEIVEVFSPGMGRTPAPQTFKSEPGSAKLTCQGKAMGATVMPGGGDENTGTVTGPFGGATCGGGQGEGTNTLTLVTDAGEKVLAEDFTFSFVMGQGEVSTESISAVFSARPLAGDCINTPLTKAILTLAFRLET